jgi:hypothetical protein
MYLTSVWFLNACFCIHAWIPCVLFHILTIVLACITLLYSSKIRLLWVAVCVLSGMARFCSKQKFQQSILCHAFIVPSDFYQQIVFSFCVLFLRMFKDMQLVSNEKHCWPWSSLHKSMYCPPQPPPPSPHPIPDALFLLTLTCCLTLRLQRLPTPGHWLLVRHDRKQAPDASVLEPLEGCDLLSFGGTLVVEVCAYSFLFLLRLILWGAVHFFQTYNWKKTTTKKKPLTS